ncbi:MULTISPECIES: zf-HC2 domain-containing protein [Streptomyces]|uniref:Zf-HC2 domain-containing protein n=1 Tax=Streptomyces koelreuteriae TaxID=2838015 RepID=A0ABX8FKS3_9ACTN|nr:MULTISPECIES: zf-HC2 domain-containing protein [Streptomyces]QWB21675.1 zf-HC2 domain-containing protein [Streptomyces koelreuteriae]UUA04601.1 zf-HC2 domain-containing protein [Streptomyces koelreuteriae]UUA12225.1 zf-HC2 domain-containing protein [Streptomyces sp. CRCS-T-1]
MRSLERHRDVGAYALGVLDEAEAFRFEDHLMECPRCAAEVTEFGVTTRQLMLYRRATPRFVHPMAQPGPRMLDRLLAEVATKRRAGRRRLLFALAASVVFAVSVPAVAMMAEGGGEEAGPVTVAATDARSGVWAQVTVEDKASGSQVELKVKDAAGPRSCHLVIVGRDGTEETATSWHGPGHDTHPNTMMASSSKHPDETARYEVRAASGEVLVKLQPR